VSVQSRIAVFCGKGGVGKTTLSLALALKHASAGRKVVVVTSHPLPELAVSVSLEGLAAAYPAVAANLFVVHFDPRDLLAELVRKNFPVEWVANAVLESHIYKSLIEVAPGLKEFYFLARLQQLAERKAAAHAAAPDFDLLLWDAPSMGHFLSTLHSARSFERFLSGPLAAAGADLTRFFSNTSRITVLPVTTLEEMAVAETVEMCRALEKDYNLAPAAVIMNMVSPLGKAAGEEVAGLRAAADASPHSVLRFALDRAELERKRAAELLTGVSTRPVAVERVKGWRTDLDLLEETGRSLEPLSEIL
jgi:anion-transporting  ArsA/GET3 family ATPase